MNGIPMNFDYSKTLNEQLPTFNYYKNRYASYELEITRLRKKTEDLKEKIILLQASEPMLEFAKETYKTNWNRLKKYLEKQLKDLETIREDISADYYIDRKMFLKEVLVQMQEIEKGKSE